MRFSFSFSLASLLLISSTIAVPPPNLPDNVAEREALSADVGASENPEEIQNQDDAPQYTTFNGKTVPPMVELNGDEFEEQTKEGYWFVKNYSPYCPHCIDIAPVWQTLYEFYYTSSPLSSSSPEDASGTSLNSFHGYYNFHFASLNCIAYGTACANHGIKAFPTFQLFKNGELVKKYEGKKNIEGLSNFIEEVLETIKPGSRAKEGVNLPAIGAHEVDTERIPSAPQAKDKDTAAGVAAGSKHNEQAAEIANEDATSMTVKETSTPTKAGQKTSKVTLTANTLGTSLPLTAESFQKLVTTTQDPWFIKFYAPWCGHCQALAPVWAQMAKEMQGKLNIGEVNCDLEPRLCKDVRVKGYPTIHFFRGGERVEYDGLRGLGDLVNYANKALDVGMGVQYVDAADFEKLEETEEVIFLYFFDHATTSEDFAALDRLCLSLIGHAKLVKTDSAVLANRFKISTWPRLLVSRDGRPTYYTALAPKDMRDFRAVLNWMQSLWLPIVPELTASNAREIMEGRFVVLGILSRERSDEFLMDKKELKNAALEWMDKQTQKFQLERQELRDAKQLRIEEAEDRNDQRALRSAKTIRINISEDDKKQVGFAWVDGVFWERWIRTTYGIDVRNGERVVINDEDNRRYWDTTPSGGYIVPSRTSILETLHEITVDPPRLTAKSTVSRLEHTIFTVTSATGNHPWISLALVAGLIIGIAVYGREAIRRARGGAPGFFHLDGKEGILSGGANGKVD
ncbi:MAG: hypothetical protein M1834_006672 [Cirrosporium novae-zelandiae]|nr:MAG: hypothetical protein M1834_006672 [Cirrosporium novae-zelandiae]